ncbi:MAG: CheR family methyltransferase, partial [Ferruginibacter sp.]
MNFENKEFKDLLESIRFVYGYDFTEYAEASVKRRIEHFMNSRKIAALEKLGKMILQDEKLFEEFIQEVSVTVTEMFRDPVFYKSLRNNVLKRLATYPFIKVWIAGCATGEEVYSIAILCRKKGF